MENAVFLNFDAMLKLRTIIHGGDEMKLLSTTRFPAVCSIAFAGFVLLSLVGCDAREEMQPPAAEVRTMIIGGVPVSEQDYKLPRDEIAFSEPVASGESF